MTRLDADFWRGRRVLVTGHTGFKGSWLVLWLARLGARVTGVALPPPTNPSLYEAASLDRTCDSRICDVRDAAALRAIAAETSPEVVFHLAFQSLVRASYRDPLGTFSTNMLGTANLLDAIRGVRSIRSAVIVTTDKVYRETAGDAPAAHCETAPLGGHDPYSASKAASEIVVESHRQAFLADAGVAVSSARADGPSPHLFSHRCRRLRGVASRPHTPGQRATNCYRAAFRCGTRFNDYQLAAIRTVSDLFDADSKELNRVVAGISTITHCAWYTYPGSYVASAANLQCLIGTIRLCEAFIAAGGHRLIGIGTCAEYDTHRGALDISTPLRSHSLYAACKTSAFLTLGPPLRDSGCSFAWCRLFYLSAEGEHPDRLTPTLRTTLSSHLHADLTDGSQLRDFLDVTTAGRRIAELATSTFSGPANICSGTGQTIRSYAEVIGGQYGRRDLLRFGARPSNLFDPPVVVGVPTVLQ